jgi:hypothetical protein
MNGKRGHPGWATALLAVVAVVAAAGAAARAELASRTGLLPATMPGIVGAVAFADDGGGQRERVIQAVQKRFNAKVVRVTETTVNGRPALELRLLSAQRVWNLVVDAATGQILSGA